MGWPTSSLGLLPAPIFPKLAASHHIFVVGTLTVLQDYVAPPASIRIWAADPRLKPYLPPSAAAALRGTFALPVKLSCDGAYEAVRQLKAAHVPILAGTDAGNPGTTQGASLHVELELLVRSGLTPVEALTPPPLRPRRFSISTTAGKSQSASAPTCYWSTAIRPPISARLRDIVAVWKDGYQIRSRQPGKASVAKQFEDEAKAKSVPPPAGVGIRLGSAISNRKHAAVEIRRRLVPFHGQNGRRKIGGENGDRARWGGGQQELSCWWTGEVHRWLCVSPGRALLFSPGPSMMAPANLSARKAIQFWAKGDGRTYEIMLFPSGSAYRPVTQTFRSRPEWKQFSFPFASFSGADGKRHHRYSPGPPARRPGAFTLALDNIRLE